MSVGVCARSVCVFVAPSRKCLKHILHLFNKKKEGKSAIIQCKYSSAKREVRIHILSHSPSFTFGIATPFCCSVCNYYYYSSSPLSACLHRSLSHTQPPSDLMQAERRENQRLFTHTQTIIKPHERNAKKEVAIAADKRELRRTEDSKDALQLNVDCLFTNSSINRNCNCHSPFLICPSCLEQQQMPLTQAID